MAAIRVAVMSLTLLSLASPAAAQFSASDLSGTWFMRGLVVGAAVDNGAAFANGTVTFNASGTVTAGSLSTALNEPFGMLPGSLVVSPDGRLTGTLGVGGDNSAFEGRLVQDATLAVTRIVGTLTRGFGTPASRSMLVVMSKTTTGTTFAQDPDATGTWRVKSLLVPDLPLSVPDVIDGIIVVERDGTISGGVLTSIVNETDISELSGALRLDAAGNFSGTLSIPSLAETSTFTGRMAPDKALMLGSIDRQISDARQFGLFEMTRLPSADAPSLPQIQPGTWELFSLQVQGNQGTLGESLGGTIEFGPGGTITGGALIGLDGQVDTIVDGSYSTPLSGEVYLEVFTEARTLAISGTLLPSLNQLIGYDFLSSDSAPLNYGFVNLVRVAATAPPPASTVEFRAASAAQRVAEGGTVTLFVDRTRATSTLVTVQYRLTGGSASLGSDYDLSGTGTLTFQPGETSKTVTLTTHADAILEGDETATLALSNPTGGAMLGRASAVVTIADNAVVQFPQPAVSIKENVANAVITVVRGGGAGTAFTVTYTATPLTAVANVHFKPVSGTLTFAAATTSRQFSVPILNNSVIEGARTVLLSLGAPTNGARRGAQATATLTIQDDDTPGTFKLDAGAYKVLETGKVLPVKVLRTGTSLAGNVTVFFRTVAGTAVDGVNYTGVSGPLTFTSGQASKTVNVEILRDFVVAPSPRTFGVELSAPDSGATLTAPATAIVTITETDLGGLIKFAADKYSVSEGGGSVTLTVLRTGGTAGGVTVDFVTHDGSAVSGEEGDDFSSRSGTLSFGSGNTSATITIPIRQDAAMEGNEAFTVELRNPRGGASLPVPPAPGRVATVTILDDETLVQFSGRFMGNMPEVVRTGQMKDRVTVHYQTISGTAIAGVDFLPLAGTLTFGPGVGSQLIPLIILNDVIAEGAETFTIQLSNPQPLGGLKLGPEAVKVFTIIDNDFGGSNIRFDAPAYSGDEGQKVTLTVRRDGGLGTTLTVNWRAVGGNALAGTDFTPAEGSVTFASTASAATFQITLASDAVVEGPEFALLALDVPAGAALLGAQSTATLTIADRTASPIQFESATYSVLETAGTATISLMREGNLDQPATVHYATVAGGSATAGLDYTPLSGTITFPPGVASVHFDVPIIADVADEGPETVNLALSSPSAGFALGPRGTAVLTIVDAALIRFRNTTYELLESAGPAEITLLRSGNLALAVTVDYATTTAGTAGPGDFSPVAGTLTFAPGAASARFFVPVIDDRVTDGPKTIGLALANPSGGAVILGAPTATIVITDTAPGYTFTEIATTSDDGFSSLALPRINDAGVVAYAGTLADGTMEIRTSDASIMLASDASSAIFPEIALNNAGHLAFGGTLADGRRGVFRVSPTTVSIIALSGSASGEFRSFGSPSLNSTGDLVFTADVIGASGVLIRTAGDHLVTVADANGNTFATFPPQPAINDAGVVLFPTFLRTETPAVFKADGELTEVANGALLDADFQVRPSSLNGPGQASFIALGNAGVQRVLTQDALGQLVTTATTESGAYANLSQGDNSPAINDAGMVAFWADLPAGSSGIFTGPIPATGKVLQTGDPLFGSTVVEISLGGLNNRGEITFRALLSNGRQVIGVATPPGA